MSRVDLSVVERFHQLDDPSAELTGLFGLQPQSLGRRLFANWRYQQRTHAQSFEVHLRGVGDHLSTPTRTHLSVGFGIPSQVAAWRDLPAASKPFAPGDRMDHGEPRG